MCASALKTNDRNHSIARLLRSYGRIETDPTETTELYAKQCSLNVSAKDLAVMGATLADGGVNRLTRQRVVDADSCRYALAVMATAGLYEAAGDWPFDIGLPGNCGIGAGSSPPLPEKAAWYVCPTARQSRQQRKRTTCSQVPRSTTGTESVRVESGGIARFHSFRYVFPKSIAGDG